GHHPGKQAGRPLIPRTLNTGPPFAGLGAALREGTKAQHMVGQAAGHSGHGVDDTAKLPRRLTAAGKPVQPQAQGVLELEHPHRGHARGGGSLARPGGDTVDILRGQAGIGNGLKAGIDGEIKPRAPQVAAHRGLADAADGGFSFVDLLIHTASPVTGSNSGSQTSSPSSKTTVTGMPIYTFSMAQLTMLVVRRNSG